VLWTAGLFVAMEMITGNIVEPWLYGSRTGLSPLAIIVAAIFWTWLWGPLGLVLSTPLTVCLVVLGRHVPQFEFLDVLFGNEPVLEPHARLYQRLLAGDPEEATDHAEEMLEEKYLFEFYDKVAIAALLLGEQDRVRGVMGDEQRRRVAASAQMLVANLDDSAREEAEEDDDPATVEPATADKDKQAQGEGEDDTELPDGTEMSVLCAGGRGELDDAAAAMLAQVLEIQGATVSKASFADMDPTGIRRLELDAVDTVVVGFLNRDSVKHARFLVRRLKRARSALRVGIVFWSKDGDDKKTEVELANDINADFVAFGMVEAVLGALSSDPPVALKVAAKRRMRRRPRPARKAPLAAAK
ncbi:MAG: AI-2E family transporter, partial [Mesorhizobium sp.]